MWHTLTSEEVRRKLKSNFELGLDTERVLENKEKYGENKLTEGKRQNIFIKFMKQFNDFMIIVLIAAAGISALLSYIEGTNDYIDSIIIISIVVLNSIMGLVQEYKAEKSLEALKKMSEPTAKVKRNGKIINIPSEELVPGDYIIIETGAYIPADSRLVKINSLKVEESALTGENIPVEKHTNFISEKNIPVGDMKNMAFQATVVVSGHAEAIVTDTGMNTKVGKIAKMIIQNDFAETPLQKKLRRDWQEIGLNSTCDMLLYLYNRIGKTYRSKGNVYDISRIGSSGNPRGVTCNRHHSSFDRCYKNGEKKQYN